MAELESESNQPAAPADQNQPVVDRLVFAALTEQRRARRWRVGFMLFFIAYISVMTLVFLLGDSDPGMTADGEKHTALVRLSGVIASGEEAGAENIIKGLRAAFKHEDTAGIVLEVNSPGRVAGTVSLYIR